MTPARNNKKSGRERQRITRTACEPCREKRAKCDGETPCGRCSTRGLNCVFVQRAWASKRSLQEDAASLKEQLHKRNCVLEALSIPGSGDDVLRLLREKGNSFDDVFETLRLQSGGQFGRVEATDNQMPSQERTRTNSDSVHQDPEGSWSPSTTNTRVFSISSQGQSPFSMPEPSTFPDEYSSQNSTMSTIEQQQQNQSAAMQQIPWLSPNGSPFGNMVDNPMAMPVNMTDCPMTIDPLLWPAPDSSESLGMPVANSWTGLMAASPADSMHLNKQNAFACIA